MIVVQKITVSDVSCMGSKNKIADQTPSSELPQFLVDFENFLEVEKGLSRNYTLINRRVLLRFFRFCGHFSPEKIRYVDIRRFLNFEASRGRRPAGLKILANAIRQFFLWLSSSRGFKNPAEHLELPKLNRVLPATLTASQIKMLLDSPFENSPLGFRDCAILELLYSSGLRVSEVAQLLNENIDLHNKTVLLCGKGGKQRILPIGSRAVTALKNYLEFGRPKLVRKHSTGHVFLGRHGKKITTVRIWEIVNSRAKAVGINEKVYPHMLRHTFATDLLRGGADLRVIQEMLGHASITTTQIYTHTDIAQLHAAYQKYHPRSEENRRQKPN